MARYIITGGTGFVGQALSNQLRANGDEVIIAARTRPGAGDGGEYVEYDLCDRTSIPKLVQAKADGVFHLAWSTTPVSAELEPGGDVATNLAGTVALFHEIAVRSSIPIVFVSSGGTVYGPAAELPIPETHSLRPVSIYGMTKAAAELYALSFRQRENADIRVARLSNPYGAGQASAKLQGAASIFTRKVLNDETITVWGDGGVVRDYIHVDDVARALAAIMRQAAATFNASHVMNVGSGQGTSLKALIGLIGELAGKVPTVKYAEPRVFDVATNILDITRIRECTGWEPELPLRLGLTRTLLLLKQQG